MDIKSIRKATEKAKDYLFLKEKQFTYDLIKVTADRGKSSYEMIFSEDVRRSDIESFSCELENLGFKVKIKYGTLDSLIISWYE